MKTAHFDRPKLERLKKAYNAAREKVQPQFDFEGNTYVTGYAKYLIEYLEMQFGLDEKEKPR